MQILDPGVVTTFFVFNMRSTYGTIPLEFLMDEEFRPLGLASIAGTMTSVKHAAINREYVLTQMGKGMRQLRRRLDRPQEANSDIILISVMFLAATAVSECSLSRGGVQNLIASPISMSLVTLKALMFTGKVSSCSSVCVVVWTS